MICAAVAAIILIPLAICFTLEQCEYFETNKSAKKKHKKSHADANGFTNASTDLPARNLRANEDTLTQLSEYQPSPSLPGEIGLQYNDNIQYRAKTSFSLGSFGLLICIYRFTISSLVRLDVQKKHFLLC